MIKRRIHTLIEYQFNKRTGKFDEVRDDVYEYDGPVTLLGGAPVDEWTDWAFYNDGTEAGSVIIGSKNTDPAAGLDVDTIYFFRVGVHESAGNKWNNPTFQFEYNYNTEGWNNVTTAAAPVQATTSGNVTNLDDTTQRMTSFTYISPNEAVSTDGLVGEGYDPESSGFEILYVFQIPADQVADGDSIELRVTTLTTFDFVNQTNPTFLVIEAAGAIETLPTVGIVNTVGNKPVVTFTADVQSVIVLL